MSLNDINSKSLLAIGKHFSPEFPIQHGLKGDVSLPLLFKLGFDYTITKA
jgi:hypothetical protein